MLLDNIDDAIHLARCAKQLHAVFESYRLSILKTIVVSSSDEALVDTLRRRLTEAGSGKSNFSSRSCRGEVSEHALEGGRSRPVRPGPKCETNGLHRFRDATNQWPVQFDA
jgi:hypothetical protein